MNVVLTHTERLYLREFWEFCEPQYLEIIRAARQEMSALPEFSKVLALTDATTQSAGDARVQDLVHAAVHRQEWQPLLEYFRLEGTDHAAAGVSLAAWYEFSRSSRRITIRKLESDTGSDRRGRARILEGLTLYQSITMQAIAEAYLRA